MTDLTPSELLPKVAICIPSGDMVHADFALSLAGLVNSTPPMETPVISAKSSIVAQARNNAVEMAQEFGADFIFFLDSDMVFPRDTLAQLLAHGREIVGATYVKRTPPHELLGAHLNPGGPPDPSGLLEMRHLPTGCLLIHKSVFDRLTRPYFRFLFDEESGHIIGEDYNFCDRAREAGFQVWCDPKLSFEIGHIGSQAFHLDVALKPEAEDLAGPPLEP